MAPSYKIVSEVWTSPDLKAVVYSKRSDPLMGEEIYQLTNIVRAEPDPSLFTIPADFTMIDGTEAIIYRTKHQDSNSTDMRLPLSLQILRPAILTWSDFP
jgi:hypothetical protein